MSNDPNKWLGLMRWSMQYSDGTRPTEDLQPMSKEDKEFLEKVMKECVIDEVERMKQITDLLRGGDAKDIFKDSESDVVDRVSKINSPEDEQEFREDMFEYLIDLVENLDNAKAFMLVGGFGPILDMVRNPEHPTSERQKALFVLGACAQNNPPCQDDLQKNGVLPILLQIVSTDKNASIRFKALGAISSLCRGHTGLEAQFIEAGGVDLLVNKLSADDDVKVKRKALFFIRALLFSSPFIKPQVCSNGMPATLVGLIGHDDIDLRESCLNAMIELVTENPAGHAAFSETQLQLTDKLDNRCSTLRTKKGEDAETAQEEISLCEKMHGLLTATPVAATTNSTITPTPTPTRTGGSTVFSFAGGGSGPGQISAPGPGPAPVDPSQSLLLKNS